MAATVPYLTCDRVMAAFDKWHVPYKTNARWRSECRCHDVSHDKGTLADEVRDWLRTAGFLLHITAGGLAGRTPEQYNEDIILGDPNVALKSQLVVAPGKIITGKPAYVILNSCGRANHVMAMSRAAYQLFRDASWPLTGTVDRRGSDVDAKAYLWGAEMIAETKADPEQLGVTLLAFAALADALGWTGQETAGHGEVDSTRTPADPNENMGAIRRRVMALVAAGPGATPIEEDSMALKDDLKDRDTRLALVDAIFNTDKAFPAPNPDPSNPEWQASSVINTDYRRNQRIESAVNSVVATQAELVKQSAATQAQLGALADAVAKIIGGQPVNLDQVAATAAKAGGDAAAAVLAAAAQAAADTAQDGAPA